ncbi:hypothetical protein M3201_22645 [Paenibacillus motobuensis]|uniref:hypothetical protein n=1 Tax=Paenibacillus TaxID=44249 RepID=UPI00203E27B3|nr:MULTISPECIES: hypothetical protein [Paenibacillus]MCM3042459.1 hypothetical protein [Paenibacillus lutimineralis]MCM3649563.1 hypothetical protein [Paenibacillus motobuensis]
MKKFGTCIISVIVLLSMLTACGNMPLQQGQTGPMERTQPERLPMDAAYKERVKLYRERTEHFVLSELYGPDGVYTNYLDTNEADTAASGHEVLSESAGLMMRYYVLMDRKADFQAEWERAKRVFELPSGFSYRYSPKQGEKYTINAAVDDLRIIRALYEAGERFAPEYTELANTYGKLFYRFNIKDNRLYDFYDEKYKVNNNFITLCYIDLKTLQRLPIPTEQRAVLIQSMQTILENGYLSDAFPFYETRYEYDTESYHSEGINTIESLLTILSLAEAGLERPESIAYLKEQVNSGALYGQYDQQGKPLNQIQSTAIYAITAMIGSVVGDGELYRDSIKLMEKYQVQDKTSPLYGGFGDTGTKQAYSFDNLMALLAYAHQNRVFADMKAGE